MISETNNPKLRWSQFRLRVFFGLLTVICMLFGAIAVLRERAKEQKRAAEWCWKMGGKVSYDGKYVSYGPIEEILGIDVFHEVTRVSFDEGQVSDLAPLAQLTSLRQLSVRRELREFKMITYGPTQVQDLSPLVGLQKLENLTLIKAKVSDVTPLSGLKQLRYLNLSGTQVRDLTPLAELNNLRRLDLFNSVANVAQVKQLQQALPNCQIRWYPHQSLASE